MPKSFPDAALILKAAVRYLEEELMPTLDGYHRFKVRVTANALNLVRRELELSASQGAAEQQRLVALLGHPGDVESLSRELSAKIHGGEVSLDDPALKEHIRNSLSEALKINNPKWLDR